MQNNGLFFNNTKILLFIIILFHIGCKPSIDQLPIYDITKSVASDSAMVVTAHPLATEIGLNILKQGGNAVDAAISIQFALAVCYPGAGNIGGGGFMIYRSNSGETAALDFREKASSNAYKDMYLDSLGQPIAEKSLYGHLAAGVPGTVDGMTKAYEKYSKLKNWEKLLQPAIDLANNGFKITEREANQLNRAQEKFQKYNLNKTAFQKTKWEVGDLLVQEELANTLISIRENYRAGFYEGKVADLIVKEMEDGHGMINREDLKNYNAVWRTPIITSYRGNKIISMPPPSSGGIALAQLLKMVEPYDVAALKFQSAAHVHLLTEVERRVYADRAKHLGDPDFYKVPVKILLDSQYLDNRMKDFNPRLASKSDEVNFGIIESDETTHFSIVDMEGNAVALTTTLNGGYGAFTVVRGAGFILNNEMDDFSVKPGVSNMYGLVGAEANKIMPYKRMLSSMTPTIVEQNNQLKMVVGSPGGSTIITTVLQTIMNVIDFKLDISLAVNSPRFHHQWLPDVIQCEKDAISVQERNILGSIGHQIKDREPIGRVEAILITPDGQLHGAADIRGDDDAKGF